MFLYLSSSSPRQANSTPATTTPYTTTRSTNIFPQSKKAGNGTSATELFSYLLSWSPGQANSAPAMTTPYTATGSTNIFLQSKKAGNDTHSCLQEGVKLSETCEEIKEALGYNEMGDILEHEAERETSENDKNKKKRPITEYFLKIRNTGKRSKETLQKAGNPLPHTPGKGNIFQKAGKPISGGRKRT